MTNPFDIVIWAIAFAFAWILFTSMTGLDDAFKRLLGRKRNTMDLAAKVETLERRVARLEDENSGTRPTA